jgi:hypothetical protein
MLEVPPALFHINAFHITSIHNVITTAKMQFLTLLATAAFAAVAAALPNRLASRGDPPAEGGGFADHCCTSAS